MDTNNSDDDEFDDLVSRAQIKRDIQAVRVMIKQLIELAPSILKKLPLDERVIDELIDARRMKKTAYQRQIKFISGLLGEDFDPEVILKHLGELGRARQESVEVFHEVEQWRDALIAGDESLMNELLTRFEAADRQHLRQLVRNARKEAEKSKPPKSSRMLFRYLNELTQSE